MGFEPSTLTTERPQNHALHRAATVNIHDTDILQMYDGHDSSGGTVTGYELSRLGIESWRCGAEIFFFSSRPALCITQPPIQ
jgi:hypothetical protein